MQGEHSDKLVLLVDDEATMLEAMREWLRPTPSGFAILSAGDGKEALALIERHRPDLVVSDVRMPGLSGIELLLESRRVSPATRFILISAYDTPEMEARSLGHGAVCFLSKPVDLARLERTILEVLADRPPDAQAGFLAGISAAGFVQFVALERQTLTVTLRLPEGRSASLIFLLGALVHAAIDGGPTGEEAALQALGWEGALLFVHPAEDPRKQRTIERSLTELLMEAMRRKDEAPGSA